MDVDISFLVISASVVVVLVSLIGAAFFYVSDETVKVWMPRLIAVAVGVLLGDAFLHLLPDALEMTGTSGATVALWTLVGIVTFVFMESVLQWRHDHTFKNIDGPPKSIASFANMNLVGDGVHNFVDGILITSSFLADPALGLATTVAIVLHEIPQEISDIAVLIQGGCSRRKAVVLNFLCSTGCVLGALMTLLLSQFMELSLGAMLAFTAGGFIYIATSDLIPLLRSDQLKVSIPTQFASTMFGIFSMQAILWLEGFDFF